MGSRRREIYFNLAARSWVATPTASAKLVDPRSFHRKLPYYLSTKLVSLGEVADELDVEAVYLKDESLRLGLPSFKILGASWGTFRAVAQKLGLPSDSDIVVIRDASASKPATLYAATDGNHGRAVARMGGILGMSVEIRYGDTATLEASIDEAYKSTMARLMHLMNEKFRLHEHLEALK